MSYETQKFRIMSWLPSFHRHTSTPGWHLKLPLPNHSFVACYPDNRWKSKFSCRFVLQNSEGTRMFFLLQVGPLLMHVYGLPAIKGVRP